ncbi:hypothetical protein [Roseimaritima sediminicola]|uniref:hypothetical protein n=1 Tax=Roseimaritima sediminicola TaxID=2662066 RepID=UPI0012984620|nr:hypothetical protein [Roseimaritima sediminicola]
MTPRTVEIASVVFCISLFVEDIRLRTTERFRSLTNSPEPAGKPAGLRSGNGISGD